MKNTIAFTAAILAISSLNLQAGILAGPITNAVNGHLYYLLTEDTWQNSEVQAVDLGGHLVAINDQPEQDWVFSTFGSYAGTNRSLWIGLREVNSEGNYQWVSGDLVSYSNWLLGQPDNSSTTGGESYVHMLNTGNAYGHPGGLWNDLASPNSGYPGFNPLCGVVEINPPNQPVMSIRVSQVEVCWTSMTNRFYQVQYRSELTTNIWTDLGSPVAGSGSSNCILDAVVPGQPRRFYQVVLLP
jgi:hypothetical protein